MKVERACPAYGSNGPGNRIDHDDTTPGGGLPAPKSEDRNLVIRGSPLRLQDRRDHLESSEDPKIFEPRQVAGRHRLGRPEGSPTQIPERHAGVNCKRHAKIIPGAVSPVRNRWQIHILAHFVSTLVTLAAGRPQKCENASDKPVCVQ
jgi:hypothetical protein